MRKNDFKLHNTKLKLFIAIFIILLIGESVILVNAEDTGGSVSIEFGETYSGSIDSAAEMDSYYFSGSAGDVVFIRSNPVGSGIYPCLKLYAPNGSFLIQSCYSTYLSLIEYSLPVSGEYLVLASDDRGSKTGSYNIYFQKLNNPSNYNTISFGETYTGSISQISEADAFVFSSSAGDSILIRMIPDSGGITPRLRLYAPNGSKLDDYGSSSLSSVIEYSLPVSGEYLVLASDRYGGKTGDYNVYFQKYNNPSNFTSIEFGETYSGSIDSAAEMDSYYFSGSAGDVVFIRLNPVGSGIYPCLKLYAPNGSLLTQSCSSTYLSLIEYPLPVSGEYLVLASADRGSQTGSYNIYFQKLNNPSNYNTISFGETYTGSISQISEADAFVFSSSADDVVLIRMIPDSNGITPRLRLYAPNGSKLDDYGSASYSSVIEYSLPVTGEYLVLASDRFGGKTGDYNVYFQTTGSGVEIPDEDTEEKPEETEPILENLPVTEVVVISTAIASVSLIGIIAGTSLGKYKFLSFLTLLGPLYLRTVREEVFDNQKRLSMYNHIAENQPVVYTEIKKTCNLSDGEINWHAHIMTQFDLIRVKRKGFHLFFYLAGSPKLSPEEFIRLTDVQKSVLDLINKKPGITQAEIVGKLGLKQQNISYNLLKLEEKGKIRVEKKGKIKYYHPVENNN